MKKNENFSDAELRRLAAASSDTGIHVPEGLEKDLSDMIDSMDAAERIIAGKSSPARRAMTLIMSAAAGIILVVGIWTAVETYRSPEDTFTDPEQAYAEVERVLTIISEKMTPVIETADNAGRTIGNQTEKIRNLYNK